MSDQRELDALQERVAELERQMKIVWPPEIPVSEADRERQDREFDAAQAERLRVNRWWRTYNAVITSITNGQWMGGGDLNAARIVQQATLVADRAHGPLTPQSET